MKKVLTVLLLLLVITGCNKTEVNYTYDIVSYPVDMSGYEGVNSTQHQFKRITVDQLFNVMDNKSSAVFYLGRTNCQCCQICIKYLNNVAKDLGVTVYYIDVYDKDMPLTDEALCDKLKTYIYEILDVEDGEKVLQTPTVFSVINGEFGGSIICTRNITFSKPATQAQEKQLIKEYEKILKPFAQ